MIIGRREEENSQLEYLHQDPNAASTALLSPDDFRGPVGVVVGALDDAVLSFAAGLVLRYSKSTDSGGRCLRVEAGDETSYLEAQPHPRAEQARTMATV